MTSRIDHLLFDSPRSLVRAWLLLAVFALGLSVLCATVLVLARAPLVGDWLPSQAFGRALVLHVNLATLVWFLSCAGALWTLRLPPDRQPLVWVAFSISVGGATCMLLAGLGAPGQPVLSNYVPMLDHPLYLGGLVWFVLGIGVTALAGLRRDRVDDSAPLDLAKLPLAMCVLSLVHACASPSGQAGAAALESAVWGAGHLLQYVYVLLVMFAWIVLADAIGLAKIARRLQLGLFLLAAVPVLVTPILLLIHSDAPQSLWLAYSQLMRWTAWPAPILMALLLLVRLWRARGGRWSPEKLALLGSIVLFSVGCAAGAAIRSETTMVPAHYHGTIGGVTAALMAMAYRMFPLLGASAVRPERARLQIAAYVGGLLVLISGLAWSGILGTPRKSPFSIEDAGAATIAAASLAGIGGVVAVGSVMAFVWFCLRSMMSAVAGKSTRFGGGGQDIRLGTIAATVTLVVGLGAALAWWPDYLTTDAWSGTAGGVTASRDGRVLRQRQAEVRERFDQGVIMLHARKYSHAITAFHRVLELSPQMPEAHVNMGFALLGEKRYPAARDFFESATSLRRDQLNGYYGLAMALDALDDRPGAVGAMRVYLHRAPDNDPFRTKAKEVLALWESRTSNTERGRPDAAVTSQ